MHVYQASGLEFGIDRGTEAGRQVVAGYCVLLPLFLLVLLARHIHKVMVQRNGPGAEAISRSVLHLG